LVLSVPALAKQPSMIDWISAVCSATPPAPNRFKDFWAGARAA
jgi:hypothetical protein